MIEDKLLIPVPHKEGENYKGILIALVIITLINSIALVFLFTQRAKTLEPETKSQEQDTSTVPSADVPKEPSAELNYEIKKIPGADVSFKIERFPKVIFSVENVVRIDGLRPEGCNIKLPEAIKAEVGVSNGCFSDTAFMKDRDYSLIGVNLTVTNNGSFPVSGDLIKLVYLEEKNGESNIKIAQRDIDFNSYSVDVFSDRVVKLSFWVPSSEKIYLAYGPKYTTNSEFLLGYSLAQRFEGAFELDFANQKLTPIK